MRNMLRNSAALIAAGVVVGLLAVGPVPDMLVTGSAADDGLEELEWLIGCWRRDSPRGPVYRERWRRLPGDTLWGASVTTRGDSVITSERLHIVQRGDTIVYVAEPEGQARTEFVATMVTARLAVFENPAHDFPQRVIYRAAGDSLHARIDGMVGGSLRAVDFPMARTACTGS